LSLVQDAIDAGGPIERDFDPVELRSNTCVVDCEWKAADRYDDGRSTVSELAQRIMGICAVELTKTRLAFHVSLNDPEIDLIEFKQAVESVENARKNRGGPPIKERL
jgi:hypothetical protein